LREGYGETGYTKKKGKIYVLLSAEQGKGGIEDMGGGPRSVGYEKAR